MIVHVYHDGSEGYEYELGDSVSILKVIGGWQLGAGKDGTVVKVSLSSSRSWITANIYVRHSSDWGSAHCYPWMLKPTPETYKAADRVVVP